LAEDVRLVVSELVGNACRHATSEEENSSGTPIVVQLRFLSEEKAIVCMIADSSDREPARVDAHHFSESGRGLALVAAFSTDWGWQRREKGGKVVWAVCGGQEEVVRAVRGSSAVQVLHMVWLNHLTYHSDLIRLARH